MPDLTTGARDVPLVSLDDYLDELNPTAVCANCDAVYPIAPYRDDDGLCGPCHAADTLDRMHE